MPETFTIYRKGQRVRLLVNLKQEEPERFKEHTERQVPKVNCPGHVLGYRPSDGHVLVKWKGKAGPVSVSNYQISAQ